MLSIFIASLSVCWIICFILISFKHVHQHVTSDHINSGPQKFHLIATPRIGGLAIFLGLFAGFAVMAGNHFNFNPLPFLVTLLPSWLAGISEDLTKKISPFHRLLAAFVASILGLWLMDARITRLDNDVIDYYLGTYFVLNVLLTMIAVGGITHAMNIIDGFNGLAATVVVMILLALAYVSHEVGDTFLLCLCLALTGATLGFLFWNYPKGSIFAGDGGAYLWGTMIAEISILLIHRNPEVSPWFPVLLLIYPTWETLFSMYRRKVIRGRSTHLPDGIHLHSLIYRRIVRNSIGSNKAEKKVNPNSRTSPYLWALSAASIVPAVFFWRNSSWLLLSIGIFILIYRFIYAKIVRFQIKNGRNRKNPDLSEIQS